MTGLARRAAGAVAVTALVTFCALEGFGRENVLRGRAQVVDGDDVLVSARKVRLSGIDAFEWDQVCADSRGETWNCGAAAEALLASIVEGREIACQIESYTKKFKRFNGVCRLDGVDIAEALVRAGLAFDVPKWSAGRYKALEEAAERDKVGAWAGTFVYPWAYRAAQRQAGQGDPT